MRYLPLSVLLAAATVVPICASTISVSCSSGGSTNSGSNSVLPDGSGNATSILNGPVVSGNTITFAAFVEQGTYTYNSSSSQLPAVFSGTWNIDVPVPSNPALDDVLEITYNTSGVINSLDFSVGSWVETTPCSDLKYGCFGLMPGTPQVSIVLLHGSTVDMHDSGTWQEKLTLPESTPPAFNPQEYAGTILTVARYLPDGVTPDPFTETPEPGTAGLGALALFSLGCVLTRKRA